MIDLSIIIVNYNSGNLLKECIESLQSNLDSSLDYEIIVVDNNSTDSSLHALQVDDCLLIIRNNQNFGFAKANNIGFNVSKGQIIHFLNPDTRIDSSVVNDYLYILKDLGRKLYYNTIVNEEGEGAKANQLVYLLGNYFNRLFLHKNVAYWNTGASIIMCRQVFIDLGKWDERYFMYAEDMDLFYTSWRKGVEIEYLPGSIFHYSGGCSENVWSNKERQKKVNVSLKIFLKKYNKAWQYRIILFLNSTRHFIKSTF